MKVVNSTKILSEKKSNIIELDLINSRALSLSTDNMTISITYFNQKKKH